MSIYNGCFAGRLLRPNRIASSSRSCPARYALGLSFGPRWASTQASGAPVPERPEPPQRSWSNTLRLPHTGFPMKHKGPVQADARWKDQTTSEYYKHQWESNNGPVFILHDGPPYANGALHMGHAMNKILKDFINRYKALRGFKVNYIPGWDCHGLPIEHKVLKEKQASHLSLAPLQIRKAARESALAAIELQKTQFREMGIMADWDSLTNTYRTMDTAFSIRQLKLLRRMVDRGLLKRRLRPTYYSPSSRTALAEAELSYKDDFKSRSVYVWWKVPIDGMSEKLKIVYNAADGGEGRDLGLAIWTTTAWTLPANQAVSIGQDLLYYLVEQHGSDDALKRLMIIAAERLEPLQDVLGKLDVLGELSGQDLLGTEYEHLFWKPNTPRPQIISSRHVTTTAGTGLVHTSPGHGQEDYEVYRAAFASELKAVATEDLDIRSFVDDEGKITREVVGWARDVAQGERLVGRDVLGDAVGEMIEILREEGILLQEQTMEHRYPCDWKTKEPVVIRSTPQWFANIDAIKRKAIESMDHINFVPQQSRRRLEAFVLGRSEWCISRQRSWGLPIPVLYDSVTGEAILTPASLEHIIPVLEARGIDSWWGDDVEAFVPPELLATGHKYTKGFDTMDVWFDSGSSWTLLRELGLRTDQEAWADVYLEGSDQHRGWFQSSLLTSICSEEGDAKARSPYANLITHGFILDQEGKKMSKSLGNIIAPTIVVNGGKDRKKEPQFGTDLLRLWAASVEYTRDASIGPTALAFAAEHQRKLRNVLKFILGNIGPSDSPAISLGDADLQLVDRYVLHELAALERTAIEEFDIFHFNRILQEINNFTANTLSTLYFPVIKDTLYADGEKSSRRQAVLAVLTHILVRLIHILSPLTPYLTEELASHAPAHLRSSLSIASLSWKGDEHLLWLDDKVQMDMRLLLDVRRELMVLLEKGREAKSLRSSAEAMVEIRCREPRLAKVLEAHRASLPDLFGVSSVLINGTTSTGAESAAWMYESDFRIAEVLDIDVHLRISPATTSKCPRCWKFVVEEENAAEMVDRVQKPGQGQVANEGDGRGQGQGLCGRCEEVVAGLGKV